MLNLFSVLMSLRDGPVPSRDAMQCSRDPEENWWPLHVSSVVKVSWTSHECEELRMILPYMLY